MANTLHHKSPRSACTVRNIRTQITTIRATSKPQTNGMNCQNQFRVAALQRFNEPIRVEQRERLVVAAGQEEMRNG